MASDRPRRNNNNDSNQSYDRRWDEGAGHINLRRDWDFKLHESTSKWDIDALNKLHVRVTEVDNILQVFPNFDINNDLQGKFAELVVHNWNTEKFQQCVNLDRLMREEDNINVEVKGIIWKLAGVLRDLSAENQVDYFVQSLLTFLGFDTLPYQCYPKPKKTLNVLDKKITTIPDFLITYKDKYILEVVESKTRINDSLQNDANDPQVCGEMLISLTESTDHMLRMRGIDNPDIHTPIPSRAVKVTSSSFTFYYSQIPFGYFKNLTRGIINDSDRIEVFKWPKYNFRRGTTLDFTDPNDRIIILKILQHLYHSVKDVQ